MTDFKQERFIRWQGRSLDYFSYAVNLFLGLSIGAIGFEISLLDNENFSLNCWEKCLFLISLISLLAASGIGISCIVNRVKDFRTTSTIVRKKSKGEYDDELEELRELVGIIGNRTRIFFSIQISAFSIGILCLIILMIGVYSHKLF